MPANRCFPGNRSKRNSISNDPVGFALAFLTGKSSATASHLVLLRLEGRQPGARRSGIASFSHAASPPFFRCDFGESRSQGQGTDYSLAVEPPNPQQWPSSPLTPRHRSALWPSTCRRAQEQFPGRRSRRIERDPNPYPGLHPAVETRSHGDPSGPDGTGLSEDG